MTAPPFQGLAAADLAAEFGTPLYVYDADVLTETFRSLRAALPPDFSFLYSLKANPSIAVCQVLNALGVGAEVSSLAELAVARRAGIPADSTVFLGPGKSTEELAACLDGGAWGLVAESFGELDEYDALAARAGRRARVLLRVNPAFTVKGSRLTMGGRPRQFGIDEEQLFADPDLLRRWPHLAVVGVHAYLGTRILDESVVAANTTRILDLADRLADQLGFPLETVDVGGGLGVAYFADEKSFDDAVLGDLLNPVVAAFRNRRPDTRLLMELGRYLTAAAGTYVVRVRRVKESMGERFAVADGGMNHHMAAAGIGSFVQRNFPVTVLGRDGEAPDDRPWNVSGPLCTPADLLVKSAALPPLRPGDLIGVGCSGAYGPTASPGRFLSHGFPAEVLVVDGDPRLVRRRETVSDLLDAQIPLDDAAVPVRSERSRHAGERRSGDADR